MDLKDQNEKKLIKKILNEKKFTREFVECDDIIFYRGIDTALDQTYLRIEEYGNLNFKISDLFLYPNISSLIPNIEFAHKFVHKILTQIENGVLQLLILYLEYDSAQDDIQFAILSNVNASCDFYDSEGKEVKHDNDIRLDVKVIEIPLVNHDLLRYFYNQAMRYQAFLLGILKENDINTSFKNVHNVLNEIKTQMDQTTEKAIINEFLKTYEDTAG